MGTHANIRLRWCPAAVIYVLAAAASLAQDAPPATLNIVVVEGEGAINNVRQRAAREPLVRIEDENHRPIAEAAVVFTLPADGPSGEFANGSKTITVPTDRQGLAAARGLKINKVSGKMPIHVNASYRGRTARTSIMQFNMTVPGSGAEAGGHSAKWIVILAIAGAAAAGGAFAAMHGGGTPAAPAPVVAVAAPIGITPGTGTIGPPR